MTRKVPPTASVVVPQEGARLHAPSAARNAAAITDMLRAFAPTRGSALEIASGTGQHITMFAQALPDVYWHPTEIDEARRASIDAHVREAGLTNVAPATALHATQDGWAQDHPSRDLIFLSNLLHLISEPEVETLINQAAMALITGGKLILYGPFSRSGTLTSDGDRAFDADLRATDPAIGYKDTTQMTGWLSAAGLTAPILHDMPANNLALIATKAAP